MYDPRGTWVAKAEFLHFIKDPFTGMESGSISGIVTLHPGDNPMTRCPGVVALKGDPARGIYISFSSQECGTCTGNHRTSDHKFNVKLRKKRLDNESTTTVEELQKINAGKHMPTTDAYVKFSKDPFMLLIGTGRELEPWCCTACAFSCGLNMESAAAHMSLPQHKQVVRNNSGKASALKRFGGVPIGEFLSNAAVRTNLKAAKSQLETDTARMWLLI
eukprot:TRINITY_DN17694_c0_g2_i1.p1 TRINITY_DN17694_c0_g2~~TRINITY_DN17694_c0_g2_i1.p1  ORF type:complete len:228 (-),score=17.49 TRINITY_DN17694_c0_g2_i1:66-719(-)